MKKYIAVLVLFMNSYNLKAMESNKSNNPENKSDEVVNRTNCNTAEADGPFERLKAYRRTYRRIQQDNQFFNKLIKNLEALEQ